MNQQADAFQIAKYYFTKRYGQKEQKCARILTTRVYNQICFSFE